MTKLIIKARAAMVLCVFVGLACSQARAGTTYAQVQAIFDAKCTNCHGGVAPTLTSAVSYNNIVPSRVTPFNAAASSFNTKITTGSMAVFLNDADRAVILAWINEGASTSYTVTPASTSPVAGSDVSVTAQLKSMTGGNLSLANVTVNWTRSGGGSLSSGSSTTNASGVAAIALTTTTIAGTVQTVTATTSQSTGTSTNIVPVVGAASKYVVTSAIPNPAAGSSVLISAQLTDANGNAVATAGKTVTWGSTGGGQFTTPTSQTDAAGKAMVTFTVSATVGAVHTVTATDNTAFTGTSASIIASPAVTSGVVELLSAKQDGGFANDSSFTFSTSNALSADGRFVVFASAASNFVSQTDNNGGTDIFVRDLLLKTTSLVTANSSGTATGASPSQLTCAISANGRYVAFVSAGSDYLSQATNGLNAYRRDLMTGQTVLCSINNNGVGADQGCDDYIAISGDGRFVAFATFSTNLGATDSNGGLDVYVRDCQLNQTILVSVNSAGTGTANGSSGNPLLNADGQYVIFTSTASNLAGTDANGTTDVYRRDLINNTTILVSAINGTSTAGSVASTNPTMTPDGRYVCFQSDSNNLVTTDTNGNVDIFRRDCNTNATTLVSAVNGGVDGGTGADTFGPVGMSSDGRYVAFNSDANGLVSGDSNSDRDVFRRDCNTNTTIVINAIDGTTTPGSGGSIFNAAPAISADGRFVGFSSSHDDLVSVVITSGFQAYRRDTETNTTALLSISAGGASGTADSQYVSLSADGYQASFASNSNNLVTGDSANSDIFGVFFNQVPSLDLGANATVMQGVALNQNGTIIDANSADTFVATVDYGDGSGVQALTVNNKAFVLNHTYVALGLFTVTVTVMDNHSAGSTNSITVNVTAGSGPLDTDGDGTPDSIDTDDDNDGATDAAELAAGTDPLDPNSKPGGTSDFDNDGIFDHVDTDDDNDGATDVAEIAAGTNPRDPNSKPGGTSDADGDGITDDFDSDDDNDGFSDVLETTTGTSPRDGTSTPTGAAALPLNAIKLSIKLNYAKPASDSISLSGTLAVPAGFVVLNAPVIVDVGGVIKSFTLDLKGRTPKGNDSFKLSVKVSKGVVAAQTAKFQAKFNKGDFAAAFQDENLTGTAIAKNEARTVDVLIIFNSAGYKKSQSQLYTAAPGKSGKTKDAK